MTTDARITQLAAELDGVTPDVMTLIDALIRQVNRREAVVMQVVKARLQDQRRAIVAEYADAFASVYGRLGRIREQSDAQDEELCALHNTQVDQAQTIRELREIAAVHDARLADMGAHSAALHTKTQDQARIVRDLEERLRSAEERLDAACRRLMRIDV